MKGEQEEPKARRIVRTEDEGQRGQGIGFRENGKGDQADNPIPQSKGGSDMTQRSHPVDQKAAHPPRTGIFARLPTMID